MNKNREKLEDKLKVVSDKMDKSEISLQEIDALYLQAENLCNNADEEERTDSSVMEYSVIFFHSYHKSKDYFLQKGKENLTVQELNLLEKIVDRFRENAPKFKGSELPLSVSEQYKDFDDFVSWVKEDTNEAKSLIQEERLNRTNKNNQQFQSQEKEIDYLKKQLAKLQNQIEELKQNQTTTDHNSNSKINQKIETLQEKKQAIQSELKQKQFQQKELKSKVNSQQNNSQPEKFN